MCIRDRDPAQVAGSISDGQGAQVSGSMKTAQEVLTAYTALSGALKEFNAGDKKLPVEAILKLIQSAAPNAGAGQGGTVNIGQILSLLQQFGGISNWNAKLENGEVQPDANAFADLADAAQAANPDSSAAADAAAAPAPGAQSGAQGAPAAPVPPAAPAPVAAAPAAN